MKKLGTMQMVSALAMAMAGNGIAEISAPKIRTSKPSPDIGKLVGVCPGGRHAWYESSVGHIRKPCLPQITVPAVETPLGEQIEGE